jgi:Ni/Fe-hydrogenase subunit HybB-like protein
MRILSRLGHITGIVALVFMALQLGDLAGRGELGRVVAFDFHSRLFLIETALILVPAVLLQIRKHRERAGNLYFILVILTIGGLMYRFVPTTVAFLPGDHYRYFPTIPEMLISGGFVALAMIGYLYTVKRYNILPVPLAYWFKADEGNLITPVHSAGGEE